MGEEIKVKYVWTENSIHANQGDPGPSRKPGWDIWIEAGPESLAGWEFVGWLPADQDPTQAPQIWLRPSRINHEVFMQSKPER
jgi:hypothetical protein